MCRGARTVGGPKELFYWAICMDSKANNDRHRAMMMMMMIILKTSIHVKSTEVWITIEDSSRHTKWLACCPNCVKITVCC